LTLIDAPAGDDPVSAVAADIPTIEMHHPRLAAVRIFGIEDSLALRQAMNALGYLPRASDPEWIIFARSMTDLKNVLEVKLDVADGESGDDVYSAFFKAVGAPEWHGRNFNALNDSIGTGGINRVEVPYQIVVKNAHSATPKVIAFLIDFEDLVKELHASGCPAEFRIQD
jgi:RNAse (barnase) inhibitor barstar